VAPLPERAVLPRAQVARRWARAPAVARLSARPQPVAALQPTPKQALARLEPALAQPARPALAAPESLAQWAAPLRARARRASAARPSALLGPVCSEHPRSVSVLSPALHRKTSMVALQPRLAPVVARQLPVPRAARRRALPLAARQRAPASEKPVPVRLEPVRWILPREGRTGGRSTSAELARRLAPALRPVRKVVPPELVRACSLRWAPGSASFRQKASCCPACPAGCPARSRCSPSLCGRRSERRYTFSRAGTFRPCRISVHPPAHWRQTSTRSRPARAYLQPIACGDSIPWLNMTW